MDQENLSREIEKIVTGWFRGPLKITERALQILEAVRFTEEGWLDDAAIFCTALERQPAVANLFWRVGIPNDVVRLAFEDMAKRSNLSKHPTRIVDLEQTLRFALPKRSKQFAKVRQASRLTTLDLLMGELRCTLNGEIGSILSTRILEGAGLDGDFWDPQKRKYVADVIQRLEFLEKLDISMYDQQFVLYWDGARYRFRPFGLFGASQLGEAPLQDGSLFIARSNVIQPVKRFSRAAFEELEYLINERSSERDFQKFFESNPEFMLSLGGGKYIELHPQVILHGDHGGSLIPDFFLEKINDHFCDICDLKLATQVLTKNVRNRPGFRSAIFEAVAQLEVYRNWFEDRRNREAFFRRTGLRAYRPRVVIIVGRCLDYYSDIDRIRRESILPAHVELVTYDDVLDRARSYVGLFEK